MVARLVIDTDNVYQRAIARAKLAQSSNNERSPRREGKASDRRVGRRRKRKRRSGARKRSVSVPRYVIS